MYAEHAPSAALSEWVECFWSHADTVAGPPQLVLPDGCADIIFDLTDAYPFVVGTMTKPLVVTSDARRDLLGVRFRPGRAAAMLGLPLAPITDLHVPLSELWRVDAAPLAERLATQRSTPARIALLEHALMTRVIATTSVDRRVEFAIARITNGRGREPIERVASEIGISRQHLARRFLEHVGIPPKTFARVMRFRRLLADVRAADAPSWSELAVDVGYYDQSHLIADFRDFAGMTPEQFLRF